MDRLPCAMPAIYGAEVGTVISSWKSLVSRSDTKVAPVNGAQAAQLLRLSFLAGYMNLSCTTCTIFCSSMAKSFVENS